ncbi:MAG: transcriptional repressor [Armatimonadia bacterium]|jgi:Fur family ferric uptake transcriptional regulator|nr:transcriptional repressor [Armatimonadia bacterium]
MTSDGFRLTRQRRAILDELRKVTSHPTADELYEAVRRQCPNISLGTVYRNLETMSANGIIRRIDVAGRQMRFDADIEPHYHIRCVHCGRVDDVGSSTWDRLEKLASESTEYEVLGHTIEFTGVCPACKERERSG